MIINFNEYHRTHILITNKYTPQWTQFDTQNLWNKFYQYFTYNNYM